MLDFLPNHLKEALHGVNIQQVYELRLRADQPTQMLYNGHWTYLGAYGEVVRKENAVYCDIEDIADCVFRAGKCSVYAVEDQIKRGFITAEHGERIGLAGEYVMDKGQPMAIRNISSLCIRIPHEILNCSNEIYQTCMSDKLRNVLICSSPGMGKTTILRDLARKIAEKYVCNILICDERGEIGVGNVGETTDVLRFCDKKTAIEAGIRAMRPDVVITDELSVEDCKALEHAVYAGIIVIASAHYASYDNLNSAFLHTFERFAVLEQGKIGQIKGIYDKNGEVLY